LEEFAGFRVILFDFAFARVCPRLARQFFSAGMEMIFMKLRVAILAALFVGGVAPEAEARTNPYDVGYDCWYGRDVTNCDPWGDFGGWGDWGGGGDYTPSDACPTGKSPGNIVQNPDGTWRSWDCFPDGP